MNPALDIGLCCMRDVIAFSAEYVDWTSYWVRIREGESSSIRRCGPTQSSDAG